ncbi:hypothetical protein [Catelliglobosispora koreensis]|uniref:hypothetical protein n=1 Tax=Catelliglobosispora koreensis TaxID=129052 RepID=UPI0003668DFF|nr:hypothetical protein [Catelliglobosispora koreensis]
MATVAARADQGESLAYQVLLLRCKAREQMRQLRATMWQLNELTKVVREHQRSLAGR